MEKSNVVQFPKSAALFTPSIRNKLTEGIRGQSEKPEEIVQTFENVLCTHIVSVAREIFSEIGRKLGEKIGKLVTGE